MAETVKERTQDSRLHAIIETAVEGIISIDTDGIIQSYNPAAEKIFQYSSAEVIGQNVKMLMPAPYRQEHDGYIDNYLTTGKAQVIGSGREVSGRRKDGSEFPMWLAIAEFFDNEHRYFTGFVRDLSTEKSYYQKAHDFEHILEHSVNEIYIFDAETLRFVRANQGALGNLLYTGEEILQLTPIDLKPEYSLEKFEKLIAPLRSGEAEKIEFTTIHRRKDDSCYPVEVHLELTEYESKQAFVAIILDITERKEAQERARINQEKLAHMDRVSMFGEMAAGFAHELNQPLTAINSYSNAGTRRIESGNSEEQKLKELFKKISASSARAADIIAHLRMMLKPHIKQTEYVSVNRLIKDAMKLVKADTQSLEYRFKVKLAKELPQVTADCIQIQQVILNLIRNAMDAAANESKENKTITVESCLMSQDNRVQVSIRDRGKGIDVENSDQIFDPFFTTKDSGMGIGLSICQTIIQEHSGKLWFRNNSDKGVTFYFTLPTILENNE